MKLLLKLAFLIIVALGLYISNGHTLNNTVQVNKPKITTENNSGIPKNMLDLLNPVKQTQNIIYDMGQKNIENAKRIQAEAIKSARDSAQKHDNEHPGAYPNEWNSISNKVKICWIHKKTHKKVCESIES